jgi:hypothetical protein
MIVIWALQISRASLKSGEERMTIMAQRQKIAFLSIIVTKHDLAMKIADLTERQLITPAQHASLVRTLAGYLPASFDLAQRTPKGAVYVQAKTLDDAFYMSFDYRGRVRHG